MSIHISPIASTASGARGRAVPSLCAPGSFKHYRRSTTNKSPRKRTFLVTMTKYNTSLCEPTGAYSHNVAMFTYSVCCEKDGEIPCGDNCNGNNNGNRGNNNGGNNNNNNNNYNNNDNNNNDSPQNFGSNGGYLYILQSFGNALLGAMALITAVATFPAASSAAMFTIVANARLGGAGSKGCPPASSLPPARPRSKVMHVPCKGSTLVVPLFDPKAVAPLPARQRCKIVDAPIELSGRDLAIINRPQYCVRESMLV
ncbi:hypothetical protein Vretimale_13487 [Volvox reticuliferus]|uniref:Uncharacterized protein n=1 Tax=Volvox reticuliferus TaxID=1737510 RepID=A0A8J4GLH7_9CHLO|nr:hypothetical protein Vretimale_13487 [Volvox reticuliferus]